MPGAGSNGSRTLARGLAVLNALGSAGEDPRWEASVSGPYEIVVRSYRDYVRGGFSDSVLLWEG